MKFGMLRKLNEFSDGDCIHSEVVVVGAGAIGIATALEVARSGAHVALIESGFKRGHPPTQDLANYDSRQSDPFHARSQVAVRRQIGGTTALWGGRCVPYDPVDFEERSFTSGRASWPVSHVELQPFYQRACNWVGCGRAIFSADELPEISARQFVPGLPDDGVRTTQLERWSLPTRFGREYAKAIKRATNLSLWPGLTCVEVVTNAEGDAVDHLVVKALDGREGKVKSDVYIIATGGLEATRLLLASNRHNQYGLGNAGGHLGRWYMSHVEARVAAIRLNEDGVIYKHERDLDGVYVRRRFSFSPELQRQRQLPNSAIWLVNSPISDPSHGSGVLSGVYLALISPLGRFLLADAIREAHTKNSSRSRISSHLSNIVRDLVPSLNFAVRFTYARFIRRGRKVPGFFVKSADNTYLLHYHGEHLPHWESRIELTDERDRLGMRKIRTHTHFSDEDYASVRRAIDLIDLHLRKHGVGRIEWLTDNVEASVKEYLEGTAGFHQIGTTRMSESPHDGVVDPNLQVHGVRGLYVASTSVLPTSSQANPTLVGIALGMRLADHLSGIRATTKPS